MRTVLLLVVASWYFNSSAAHSDEPQNFEHRDIIVKDRWFLGNNFNLRGKLEDGESLKIRPVFRTLGEGSDWRIQPKGDHWLVSTKAGIPGGRKRYFLSFAKTRQKDSQEDLVILREEPDESSLWHFEFEGNFKNPAIQSKIFCTATTTTGDWQGYFLAVGDPFEMTIEGVKKEFATVALQKENSEKARLKIKLDGP
jgi:hypothetical protein